MEFKNTYGSEDACREHLFKNKWSKGFICEKCGCFEYYYIATRKSYECKGCSYQACVTSNTIMHKTHTTLEKWFWAIYLAARETVLSRNIANTRPRDFYDIYILYTLRGSECSPKILKNALEETAKKRGSLAVLTQYESIVDSIKSSPGMRDFWTRYQKEFDYAKDITFDDTCNMVLQIMGGLTINR